MLFLCIRISREHGFLLLVVLREPLLGTGVFPVRNHFRPTGEPDRSTRKLAVGCFLVQTPQTWLGLTVVLSFNCLGFASLRTCLRMHGVWWWDDSLSERI